MRVSTERFLYFVPSAITAALCLPAKVSRYLLPTWNGLLSVAGYLPSQTTVMTGRAAARSATIKLRRSNHLSLCVSRWCCIAYRSLYLSCPEQRNPSATSRTCSGIRTYVSRVLIHRIRGAHGRGLIGSLNASSNERYLKPSIALGTFRRRWRTLGHPLPQCRPSSTRTSCLA